MIAVIDVCGNNLTSLGNALKRLGFEYQLTHNIDDIQKASHVILPGVGTAVYGMKTLRDFGLIDVLSQLTQPLLGICLGMQLLLDYSEEGQVHCLGLIPGRAELLTRGNEFPVPHMGWNQLQWQKNSQLHHELDTNESVYFVHSFALKDAQYAVARCTYSEEFTAIVNKKNIYGMQFHPEKSAESGMKLLRNFLSMEAVC